MSFPIKRSQKCPRNLPIRVKGVRIIFMANFVAPVSIFPHSNLSTIDYRTYDFHSICKIRWYPFLVEMSFPKSRNHNDYYENCIHRNPEYSCFLLVLPKFELCDHQIRGLRTTMIYPPKYRTVNFDMHVNGPSIKAVRWSLLE